MNRTKPGTRFGTTIPITTNQEPSINVRPQQNQTIETSPSQNTVAIGSHEKLSNRDKPDQHPIEAITGLREELESKANDSEISEVARTGQFEDLEGFKPLTIGDIVFDGTEEKEVPVYRGTSEDPETIFPEVELAPMEMVEEPTEQMPNMMNEMRRVVDEVEMTQIEDETLYTLTLIQEGNLNG